MTTTPQLELFPGLPPVVRPTIYCMTDLVRVKFGFTDRPPRRRGGELKAEVLFSYDGDMEAERREHRRWAASRIGTTEWFEVTPTMLVYIALNVGQNRDARAAQALEWLAANTEASHARRHVA